MEAVGAVRHRSEFGVPRVRKAYFALLMVVTTDMLVLVFIWGVDQGRCVIIFP